MNSDDHPQPDQTSGDDPSPDTLDQLRRLGELRDAGILTDDEFAAQKAAILSGKPPRRRRRPSRRALVIAAAVLALVAAAGTGVALKIDHDNDVQAEREREERRAAAEERREAAEREAEAELEEAEAEAALEEVEIDIRRDLVQSLRKSVTADFRKRVSEGGLDGPILGTTCEPVEGGVEELDQETGKFECLVATERTSEFGRRGYPVDATVNYTSASYTWQLSP